MHRHQLSAWLLSGLFVVAGAASGAAQIRYDLDSAELTLDHLGRISSIVLRDGSSWPVDDVPVFSLQTSSDRRLPVAVELADERLRVRFEGGSSAEFAVRCEPGRLLFELKEFQQGEPDIQTLRLFHLPVPPGAELAPVLNACSTRDWTVALMGAERHEVLTEESVPATRQ